VTTREFYNTMIYPSPGHWGIIILIPALNQPIGLYLGIYGVWTDG
jgi:hypothetical protein